MKGVSHRCSFCSGPKTQFADGVVRCRSCGAITRRMPALTEHVRWMVSAGVDRTPVGTVLRLDVPEDDA